ncbi:MAG: YigZ family protein [Bacteroidetes bacterium]|nr:YigZ family protein [Bacteroidota bacterium]
MASFSTIKIPGESLFKDKGSKFYGYAYRADSVNDVEAHLKEIGSLHPKARHVCYAYLINEENGAYRANDDGEPSNSAGTPILNQIRSANVAHVLVVVVRYFGGTLLGVPGLINAYKTAAKLALDESTFEDDFEREILKISFSYEQMEDVMKQVKRHNLSIINAIYQETCQLEIELPLDDFELHNEYFSKFNL